MTTDLIGTDNWMFDGYALTPEMREKVLLVVGDFYNVWKHNEFSYEWKNEENCRGFVEIEPHPVATVDEFLGELTGEQDYSDGWSLPYYGDDLFDWFKRFLIKKWGDGINDDDDEPDEEARCRVEEWLSGIRLEDLEAWRLSRQTATEGAVAVIPR